MGKVPSPCIDVCKFKRQGHCIGCGMTKPQKRSFKKLDGRKKKLAFLNELILQQMQLGGYPMWSRAYRKLCRKKGVECPLDASVVSVEDTAPRDPTTRQHVSGDVPRVTP